MVSPGTGAVPRALAGPLWRAGAVALGVAALASPTGAAAQAPGYSGPGADRIRAEYRKEVLERVGEVVERWTDVWAEDDADALAELYADDAVLILPGGQPSVGREAVRDELRARLPEWGRVELFLQDFDASGTMAVTHDNYEVAVVGGVEAGRLLRGPVLTVYRRAGRRWRIRSQVFREPG